MICRHALRVPLHAEDEEVPRALDALDQPVAGAPRHRERAGVRDRLVMAAVDGPGLAAEDRGEPGPRDRMQVVEDVSIRSGVRQGFRPVVRDVGVERPAFVEGEELHAVADPEEGDGALSGALQGLGVLRELRAGHRLEGDVFVALVGDEVGSARYQETVESRQGRLRPAPVREEERLRSGLAQRLRVGRVEGQLRFVSRLASPLGDADDRRRAQDGSGPMARNIAAGASARR